MVYRDPAKEQFAEALQQRGADLTPVRLVIRTGESFLTPEITTEMMEGVAEDRRKLVADLGLRSAIMVPLRGRGGVYRLHELRPRAASSELR